MISCVSVTREEGKFVGRLINMNGIAYEATTNTLLAAMWALTQAIEEMEDSNETGK